MGRKYADDARRPSVWDVDALRRSMDALQVSWSHSVHLLGYLARHPEVAAWDDVAWGDLRSSPPRRFKEAVAANFSARSVDLVSRHDSSDGSTSKLVVGLRCGKKVETVVMRHGTLRSSRVTVCVSSQVGCAMRCSFCATGTMGMQGDLTRGEIVEQVLLAKGVDGRLRNVVFMGMGEPLNNYDEVLGACRCLLDDRWLALGGGRVTISTVGVVDRIRSLAADEPRANLALSLHAPTQDQRVAIMPAAKRYDLDDLLDALDAYVAEKLRELERRGSRKRRNDEKQPLIMVEYILLGGVNDSVADADALGKLFSRAGAAPRFGGRAMVNLIAYNPTPDLPYDRPSDAAVAAFQKAVQAHGVLTCVRITMGSDVAGACGQLLKDTRAPDVEDAVPGPPRRRKPAAPRARPPAPRAAASAAPRSREAVAAALAVAGLGFGVAAYLAAPGGF